LPFKALVRRRDGHSSGEAPLLSACVPKRLGHILPCCSREESVGIKPPDSAVSACGDKLRLPGFEVAMVNRHRGKDNFQSDRQEWDHLASLTAHACYGTDLRRPRACGVCASLGQKKTDRGSVASRRA